MERFLDRIAAYPAVLLAPIPMTGGTWVTEARLVTESARLPELYAALARQRDLPFVNPGTWGIEMAFDGAHYTAAGHRAFAAKIQEALTAIAQQGSAD